MKPIAYLILSFLFTWMHLQAQNNHFAVQAQTDKGTIEGSYDIADGIQTYLGVPYAKPPVGELRWKAPQPMDNWEGVKMTKKFGPRAMQAPVFGDMNFRSDGLSEDCLYLNIWTHAKYHTKGLPVLVYFYGGGFAAGDGSEPRYDGESMAKKGIVTVTVNYRLNIFGFLAHPELSAEASYKASGNYGLLDQSAALHWVKKNIAAFGGDPDKITIAGESAGSISVSAQMASPLSKDLLAGAIGESGAAINPTMAPVPLQDAEKIGRAFAQKAGVSSLKALRAMSTREIYELYVERGNLFGFPTVIDGYFYPKSLPEIYEAGEQAQVPLLLGWNSAEIPGMAFMEGKPYTEENYMDKMKKAYPKTYKKAMELYPYGSKKEIELSATALASDRFIAYSTWKWFDLHRKNSKQPVYRYLYSRIRPPLKNNSLIPGLAGGTLPADDDRAIAAGVPQPVGAPHACEIEYCMGNLHLVDDYAWAQDDYKVSRQMQAYFANFIKTGDPNGEDLVAWPAAKAQTKAPKVMIIDAQCKVIDAVDDKRYEFLDGTYMNQ